MSYTFVRWVRFGVAAALDSTVLDAGAGPRARLTIGADVGAGAASRRASLAIDVLGPGDVSGVDSRQVVRTFPVAGTLDFESAYLAHIEFDRADFPWIFTPGPPLANGSLVPWLGLVVIEKREGVRLDPATPLPRLTIENAAGTELPPPGEAHLWAHVQITGDIGGSDIRTIARDQPERVISRLICPRRLQPEKSYYACLVPTFKVGLDAGLGAEVPPTAGLDAAWSAATDGIVLPVYYHWEFATGGTGDFKSLVTRLEAQSNLPNVGTRTLDVTTPGYGVVARDEDTTVPLGGALRVSAPLAPPANAALATDLANALALDGLAPPTYGRWHAGVTTVGRTRRPRVPAWLEALNLDPRYRVAAGIGTQVVQERQEDLMAAIWEQLGEIQRANQLLRNAQLAIAAAERVVARHFASVPDADLLSLAGPALSRIAVGTGRTARRTVAESCAPVIAFSGAFRRVVRPHGPLGRRLTRLKQPDVSDVMHVPSALPAVLLAGFASGTWNRGRIALPHGAVAAPASIIPKLPVRPLSPGRAPRRGNEADALGEVTQAFARLARRDRASTCTPLDIPALASQVRAALVPDVAIPPRVRAQIALPADVRVYLSDRLDPIMAAPEIATPMIGPLMALGQEWLLPGIENVPPNTVTTVEPDAAFIESYLVGLNHEMGRELLWRGFPTDQRGTVFSRFWDRRGSVAAPPDRDIPKIAEWKARDRLGAHLANASGLVLLIRGELLARYPRATIFMQRARWKRVQGAIVFNGAVATREPVPLQAPGDWDTQARFPEMTGRAGADVVFMGFGVPRAEARGLNRTGLPATATDDQAGWYVVFQEQPTEPRFERPLGLPPAATQAEQVATACIRPAFRLFVHGSDLVSG